MTRSPKEAGSPLKEEGDDKEKASSSSAQWLRLKDPRIVRVSRAFGGKDRHSKVSTVRGLRDRRVRLSVPTAIQLYDLQDRLGLNQPSKVVDWLLNAAKDEIDELPPLPVPPGSFSLCHNPSSNNEVITTSQNNINDCVSGEMVTEKGNWNRREEEEGVPQVLQNNLLSRGNHASSFLGLMNTMPPVGNYQWENHGFSDQRDHLHSINVLPFPSTLSLSTAGTSQILVCPPGATQPYNLSSQVTAMDMDPRQINHYQMLSSSSQNHFTNSSLSSSLLYPMSQSVKPFSLSMNSSECQSSKDRDFPSK